MFSVTEDCSREVRKDMAVTRREFVTNLGMLAAAMGLSQTDLARVTEAFGHASPAAITPPIWGGAWTTKPKVIWVHGAECTGCSTSVLSLYEDASGTAVTGVSTAAALALVGGATLTQATKPLLDVDGPVAFLTGPQNPNHPNGHRTLNKAGLNVDGSAVAVNIADVLIDFIDLQYHETVMGMGGDGAYAYLDHEMTRTDSAPFVLIVEGAVQKFGGGGYWGKNGTAHVSAPWCAIAMDGTAGAEHELNFDAVVETLADKDACVAVVAVGQCAAFGGYPACNGPDLPALAGRSKNQTGAQGVFDFLISTNNYGSKSSPTGAAAKVINVPGCPVNPWWFTLTVVAWLVDAVTATSTSNGALGILNGSLAIVGNVDSQRRLTAVYGNLLHGKYCPRYSKYTARIFASKPGDDGCLKNIGCKGISTMSSCGRHGWNNAQPQNAYLNADDTSVTHVNGEVPALYSSTDRRRPVHGLHREGLSRRFHALRGALEIREEEIDGYSNCRSRDRRIRHHPSGDRCGYWRRDDHGPRRDVHRSRPDRDRQEPDHRRSRQDRHDHQAERGHHCCRP
jgi:hydrogenase small subunit